jgi:3-mercaptopyruvate sulfurtransferase SseA
MNKKRSAGDTARKSCWLILAAVVLAAGINLFHPQRIPWVEDWGNRVEAHAVRENVALVQLTEMIEFLRDGSRLLVDARSAEEYAKGHIPGAISAPFMDEKIPDLVLQSQKLPVFYCSGRECDDGLLLALDVRAAGREDVAVFIGGMELWESELLQVEEEAGE